MADEVFRVPTFLIDRGSAGNLRCGVGAGVYGISSEKIGRIAHHLEQGTHNRKSALCADLHRSSPTCVTPTLANI